MNAKLCGCCTTNKKCNGFKAASKELWRLRLNWFFIMTTSSLFAISYTSISSSFHQFVTNPVPNTLQNITKKIEPGLGESEALYSWMIMAFNFGAFVGALGAGFLIKFLPYWHLMLAGLLLHTLGYVLYAVTTHGWLILLSKLLSGLFIGMEMTIALAYFAENSVNYQAALKETGKDKKAISGLRGKLFALDNIAVNIGYLLGPGVASIFAQFNIDQFRSIAWYNAGVGVALIVLQFAIFHGESNCKKFPRRCKLCSGIMKKRRINTINIVIITFLVIARGVLSFRFGVYETLYNPVLSDTFGFTEKESSYFFFGLVSAQIAGTVILLTLQQVRLDNRIIAILGLVMTVVASVLIADWQSIPYDPCTEFSPFHHRERENHTTALQSSVLSVPQKIADVNCQKVNMDQAKDLESIIISARIQLQFRNFETHLTTTMTTHCQRVHSCPECTDNSDHHLCLKYTVVWGSCIIPTMMSSEQNVSNLTAYSCNSAGSTLPVCILLDNINTMTDTEANSSNRDQLLDGFPTSNLSDVVHHQELELIEESSYNVALNRCEAMSTSQYHCHWLPDSLVTGRQCHDCPPICRSLHQTLNFAQFTIGAALLMVSLPIAWVPMATMVSYKLPKEAQGMLMGTVVALSAIGRSVSPLWLDAAYERFQKRTFVPMIILISTHLPLVVGVIVLYQKLGGKCDDGDDDGTKTTMEDSSTESDTSMDSNDSEFEKSINESSHLMPTEESKL